MNATIELLARTTVSTSVVILLLLACRYLLARRLGAQAVYLLWLGIPMSLLLLLPLAFSPVSTALPTLLPPFDIGQVAAGAPPASNGIDASTLLGIAWLTGCLAMLLYLTFQVREAARLAAAAIEPAVTIADFPIADTRAKFCDAVASPVVVGLLRPLVLLPSDFLALDARTRTLVLRHEALHAQRRDNLVNLFAGALLAVFWFNPLAWIGLRAFRIDQELSCDAHALTGAGPHARIDYARTLVTLADASALPALTSAWNARQAHVRQSMKRRIAMLNAHQDSHPRLLTGMALVAVLVAAALLVAPPTRAGDTMAAEASQGAGEIIPIVRINPGYPRAAAENRTEGFVTAEFTITENGSVADIVVLDSEPAEIFDRAATDALAKWRFQPRVKDGTALPFRATQIIEFAMD